MSTGPLLVLIKEGNNGVWGGCAISSSFGSELSE